LDLNSYVQKNLINLSYYLLYLLYPTNFCLHYANMPARRYVWPCLKDHDFSLFFPPITNLIYSVKANSQADLGQKTGQGSAQETFAQPLACSQGQINHANQSPVTKENSPSISRLRSEDSRNKWECLFCSLALGGVIALEDGLLKGLLAGLLIGLIHAILTAFETD
jgi:hypothetical protein